MSALKEECFCRLQLLSTKGVTPVLVKVLEDVVWKTCNGDFDKFLNVFKKEILVLKNRKIINASAYQVLFPKNGKTDINTWDITLLTCILINFCTLEERCNKKKFTNLLEQEAANNGVGIQAFLATNKCRLDQNVKSQISDIQYDQIYPTSGVPVDITTWDFEVLVIVLAICSTAVRSQDLKDLLKPLVRLETDLSQFNIDLVAFLQKHSTLLDDLEKNGIISNQQHKLLYPAQSLYPDVNTWDQWLLVTVILNVCRYLKSSSIKAIKSLRSLRNTEIAHASSPEIDENIFRSLWKKIVDNIEIVIENEVQGCSLQQWNESISHIRSGPLNKQESIDILKEWYKDRNETNENISKLDQKVEEMRLNHEERDKKLEQQINELALNQKQGFKELNDNVQVISVKRPDLYKSRVEIQCLDIRIVLKGNNIAAVRKAEDLIRQAMEDEADVTKKDAAAMLSMMVIKEVTEIKKEITKEGSVIEGVVEGSIILRMRCHTLFELNYLLQYEGQLVMNMQFEALASAIGPIVGDTTIAINAGITDYSVTELSDNVRRICLENDIELPLLVDDDNQPIPEATVHSKNDDDVGTTDDSPQAAGPLKTKKSLRAEKIGTYNIKYPGDKSRASVDSCVLLPTGDIVVCDEGNSNIKLFDETFTRRDLLKLKKAPWDSSLSSNDNTQVLVTIPDKKTIYTIMVDNKLRKGRKLRVNGECRGITCLVTGIAVTVKRGVFRWEIQLILYDGQLLKTILPDTTPQLELKLPYYMTSINWGTKIVISDNGTNCSTAVDVDTGRVEFVYIYYSDPSLRNPRSVTSDNEANIYVAGYFSDTVDVISRTGEKIGDILTSTDGLDGPRGVCYNKLNNTLLLQPRCRKSEICVYNIVKDDV